MSSTKRQNRRKQNISALSAESEFPLPHTKWQRAVPSPNTAPTFGAGISAGPGGDDDDLEDEELRFRGFSYTYDTDRRNSLLESFACHRCPAIFNSRIGLTNHSKLHGARLPLGCDLCDFSCTNTKTLRQHRRAHGFLPRPRRPSTHKCAEMRKPEKRIIGLCANKAGDEEKISAAADAFGDGSDGCAEQQQQFGDPPPMLARATLNRAGLEEEEEEEAANWGVQQQSIAFSSATTSTKITAIPPPKLTGKTTTTANRPRTNNYGNNFGTFDGTRRRQKGGGSLGPIRCAICPFTTPSRVRLQSHMNGHYRSSGFLCSVCEFKHESVGWLHLHCTLHLRKEGIQFQWPPVYVKEAEEEEKREKDAEEGTEKVQDKQEETEGEKEATDGAIRWEETEQKMVDERQGEKQAEEEEEKRRSI